MPLLTEHQAARLLNISIREFNRMVREGLLPYVPFSCGVRFDEDELRQWIKANTVRPDGRGEAE